MAFPHVCHRWAQVHRPDAMGSQSQSGRTMKTAFSLRPKTDGKDLLSQDSTLPHSTSPSFDVALLDGGGNAPGRADLFAVLRRNLDQDLVAKTITAASGFVCVRSGRSRMATHNVRPPGTLGRRRMLQEILECRNMSAVARGSSVAAFWWSLRAKYVLGRRPGNEK
jgi:hypothetical protein